MVFGNIDNMFQVVLDGDDIVVTSPTGIHLFHVGYLHI